MGEFHAAIVQKFVPYPARDADELGGSGASGWRDKIIPKLLKLRGLFGFSNEDGRYAIMDRGGVLLAAFHLIIFLRFKNLYMDLVKGPSGHGSFAAEG